MDLLRFLAMSVLVAAYVALVLYGRRQGRLTDWQASTGRAGGVMGACAGVLGLSTGPCSVVGCGAGAVPRRPRLRRAFQRHARALVRRLARPERRRPDRAGLRRRVARLAGGVRVSRADPALTQARR